MSIKDGDLAAAADFNAIVFILPIVGLVVLVLRPVLQRTRVGRIDSLALLLIVLIAWVAIRNIPGLAVLRSAM